MGDTAGGVTPLVKAGRHGRMEIVFKMREEIEGSKRKVQEPNAIKDPKTGEIIGSSNRIKAVTLQYCIDTLQNNKLAEDYEKLIELKKELHYKRMEERNGDVEVTKEDFEDIVKRFKEKPTKTYDFLVKAGEKYRAAMYLLCKRIIDTEEIHKVFYMTTLHMLSLITDSYTKNLGYLEHARR